MLTHFTCVIHPNYRGFNYCGIFRGNNNHYNLGIPVQKLSMLKAEACPRVGYADNGHSMTYGHSISQRAWK
jgi:hypothetical protein